ncbi:hypothetical protein CB1_75 [Pectobacterium phage vB_PatP_CB1]|uniref:Uncharacterized protein n=2 Tax=Cbunavirus TaxID=2842586 RepID=A0A2P0PB75_9CAUD|nr:hypothetical protein HWB08_gp75 [Pectobacterium phage vB_PatP_CB1]YP_009832408.1 hypothetical protein HWB09_gp079 [Pectobacterium phage vB_PatP_CB4]AQT27921.1 hypothetical protein CB4_79 [Pectobacterium phage vB_PatP_CB4]ARB11802.1 hypothetical protein CB1_75 [Pectobacterium phage vB_PatP_CB1]
MQIILSTDDILRLVLLGLKHETNLAPVEIHIGPINGEIKAVAGVGEEVPQGTFDDDDTDPVVEDEPKATGNADAATPGKKRRKRRTKEEIAADEAKAKQAAETQQPQQPVVETETKGPDAQQPETKGTETEKALETKPETGSDKAASTATETQEAAGAGAATTDLFADPAGSVEQPAAQESQPEQPAADLFAEPEDIKEVVTSAGQNPFGGNTEAEHPEVTADSLDLFSDPAPTANAGQPTTQTEDGFVKPAGDDKVLDLFS